MAKITGREVRKLLAAVKAGASFEAAEETATGFSKERRTALKRQQAGPKGQSEEAARSVFIGSALTLPRRAARRAARLAGNRDRPTPAAAPQRAELRDRRARASQLL